MRINHARHQGAVSQIDDLGVRRMVYAGADLSDSFPFNEYFGWRKYLSVFDVQQPRRMEHDRM